MHSIHLILLGQCQTTFQAKGVEYNKSTYYNDRHAPRQRTVTSVYGCIVLAVVLTLQSGIINREQQGIALSRTLKSGVLVFF